jgi:hypothetical protein
MFAATIVHCAFINIDAVMAAVFRVQPKTVEAAALETSMRVVAQMNASTVFFLTFILVGARLSVAIETRTTFASVRLGNVETVGVGVTLILITSASISIIGEQSHKDPT